MKKKCIVCKKKFLPDTVFRNETSICSRICHEIMRGHGVYVTNSMGRAILVINKEGLDKLK